MIPVRLVAKKVHVVLQTIGLICMFIGLAAVIKDQATHNSNNLTTMHSWYGVMAIAVYAFNYLWGASMGLLTEFHPNNMIKEMIPLKSYHQVIGLAALSLCVIAIATGINNELGQGQCWYVPAATTPFVDINPAQNYMKMPNACKLANGLGVVVFLSFWFIGLSVYIRNHHMNKVELPTVKSVDDHDVSEKFKSEADYDFKVSNPLERRSKSNMNEDIEFTYDGKQNQSSQPSYASRGQPMAPKSPQEN